MPLKPRSTFAQKTNLAIRSIGAAGLALLLLLQPVLPYLEYVLLKDYIARNLCVERNQPKSCCQGKCHLQERLQESYANEQAPRQTGNKPIRLKTEKAEYTLPLAASTTCLPISRVQQGRHRPAPLASGHSLPPFHPPQTA